jgi:hypothetical protein
MSQAVFWILLFAIITITAILKRPRVKGKIGEAVVNLSNSFQLDKNKYTQIKDVTLELVDGSTTQIDHIVASKYGIFVIETKNMKGRIFGGEHQKQWTQQIYKVKNSFQNPLQQNLRHTKALEEVLELSPSWIFPVVVFVGECEIMTPMPRNVCKGLSSYAKHIKSFSDEIITESELSNIITTLEQKRLKAGAHTDAKHIQNLQSRHAKISMACDKCGSEMVVRKNKTTGEEFYGCSAYPRCRNMRSKL